MRIQHIDTVYSYHSYKTLRHISHNFASTNMLSSIILHGFQAKICVNQSNKYESSFNPARFKKGKKVSSVVSLIEEASLFGCELACLPEHWIFTKDFNSILNSFIDVARKNEIAILTGGCYVENNDAKEIVCYAINKEGGVIGSQKKVHLYEAEKEVAIPSNEYNVFDINGYKVGVAICYDLVFPEAIRILVLKGLK